MSTILLFNIEDPIKKEAIRLTALRFGIKLLEILPGQQGMTLEELLGSGQTLPPPAQNSTTFTDEMLIMHALNSEQFHGLLDTLRSTGQTVRLKAIVTEHNKSWSAVRLHRELCAEEAAMRKQAVLQKQHRNSEHRKHRR